MLGKQTPEVFELGSFSIEPHSWETWSSFLRTLGLGSKAGPIGFIKNPKAHSSQKWVLTSPASSRRNKSPIWTELLLSKRKAYETISHSKQGLMPNSRMETHWSLPMAYGLPIFADGFSLFQLLFLSRKQSELTPGILEHELLLTSFPGIEDSKQRKNDP